MTRPYREQIKPVKATVAELHPETQRLTKPDVNGRNRPAVMDKGGVVPVPSKADRKKALRILRSMRGLQLPVRK